MLNKRSSLEISIQAIVIVVLAMTLLGLGLGFIKGMFGKIGGLSDSAFAQIEDQLQRDLVNSNEKLIFSQTKITIERGKSALLGWGVKNEGDRRLDYWAEFTPIKCPATCPSAEELNTIWFTYKHNPGGQTVDRLYSVDAADSQVVKVDLTVPKNAPTGLYLIDLSVWDSTTDSTTNEKYSSTDVFITIA